MQIVYRAENVIDAQLVKDALEGAGIRAFVSGSYLTGAIGQLPAWDYVSVMVAPDDVERAVPVIRQFNDDRADCHPVPVPVRPVPRTA